MWNLRTRLFLLIVLILLMSCFKDKDTTSTEIDPNDSSIEDSTLNTSSKQLSVTGTLTDLALPSLLQRSDLVLRNDLTSEMADELNITQPLPDRIETFKKLDIGDILLTAGLTAIGDSISDDCKSIKSAVIDLSSGEYDIEVIENNDCKDVSYLHEYQAYIKNNASFFKNSSTNSVTPLTTATFNVPVKIFTRKDSLDFGNTIVNEIGVIETPDLTEATLPTLTSTNSFEFSDTINNVYWDSLVPQKSFSKKVISSSGLKIGKIDVVTDTASIEVISQSIDTLTNEVNLTFGFTNNKAPLVDTVFNARLVVSAESGEQTAIIIQLLVSVTPRLSSLTGIQIAQLDSIYNLEMNSGGSRPKVVFTRNSTSPQRLDIGISTSSDPSFLGYNSAAVVGRFHPDISSGNIIFPNQNSLLTNNFYWKNGFSYDNYTAFVASYFGSTNETWNQFQGYQLHVFDHLSEIELAVPLESFDETTGDDENILIANYKKEFIIVFLKTYAVSNIDSLSSSVNFLTGSKFTENDISLNNINHLAINKDAVFVVDESDKVLRFISSKGTLEKDSQTSLTNTGAIKNIKVNNNNLILLGQFYNFDKGFSEYTITILNQKNLDPIAQFSLAIDDINKGRMSKSNSYLDLDHMGRLVFVWSENYDEGIHYWLTRYLLDGTNIDTILISECVNSETSECARMESRVQFYGSSGIPAVAITKETGADHTPFILTWIE